MQQFMHSFEGYAAPQEIVAGVKRGEISSFCLFAHKNVTSPAQVRELTDALYHAAQQGNQPPPLIGIDQEGGQLIAIRGGATELPGNMALGATRSVELAEQAGRLMARELLAMGLNLNFAPALDVNINPLNPVIGIRSFGDDALMVAALGSAMIRGMQAEGIVATAKHFPGHGDISQDTHYSISVVDHPMERMNAVELVPFRSAIENNVGAIMTAHLLFSALDEENIATMSRPILTNFLRKELGFNGLIITDAMDMAAALKAGVETSIETSICAGADLVLLGHLPDQLHLSRKMAHLAKPSAVKRIRCVRNNIPTPPPSLDVVGCAEHQQLAQQIADQSITVVRENEEFSQLPLQPALDDTIVVITPAPVDLTPADTSSGVKIALADAVRHRHRRVKELELPHQANQAEIAAVLRAAKSADIVIIGTISVERDPSQIELVRALYASGKHPIVVSLRTPYDLVYFPMIRTYLCAYGIRPVTMEAIAKVLFGEIEAQGELPCALPDIDSVVY